MTEVLIAAVDDFSCCLAMQADGGIERSTDCEERRAQLFWGRPCNQGAQDGADVQDRSASGNAVLHRVRMVDPVCSGDLHHLKTMQTAKRFGLSAEDAINVCADMGFNEGAPAMLVL